MKSFLERRDRWGNGYSLWLITAAVFLIPLCIGALRHLRMENDVAGWLPKDDPQAKILAWYQSLFPETDRILISWDDCTLTDVRLNEVARRLKGIEKDGVREGGLVYVSGVSLPTDLLKRMVSEGIDFETSLDRARGLLVGDGPLCLSLTGVTADRRESVIEEILKLAEDTVGVRPEILTRTIPEPTDEYLTLEDEAGYLLNDAIREHLANQKIPDIQLSWKRMHLDSKQTDKFRKALSELKSVSENGQFATVVGESWYAPGSMAAMSVELSEAGSHDHSAALKAICAAVIESGVPKESLHLGGRPVAGTLINEAVKHAGWNRTAPFWNMSQRSPLLLSVFVSVGLSYLLLRSVRLCLLVQTVSIFSAILSVALVPATGGTMNMVLIVMPTLLLVISISGTIHICNYWKTSGIDDPVKSVLHAASTAWLPCLLASGTTAIGLASLMVSSLVPVRDFGIYASIGCMISFFCVLYILPGLMLYWPEKPPKLEQVHHHRWNSFGKFLARHNRVSVALNLVFVATCCWGFHWFRTETKVIRYFADESQVVKDYNFLEENLSGIASVDTLVRFNLQQQEEIPFLDRARRVFAVQQALRNHSEVSGTLSLASFLKLEQPDAGTMTVSERRKARMRENMIGDRIHQKIRQSSEPAEGESETGNAGNNNLTSMIMIAGKAGDWQVPGDERLNSAGDEIWRITCQSSIMSDYDYARLTSELDEIAENQLADLNDGKPAHVVTGLIPIFLRTQQALLESLINSFAMAFLLIGLVMIALLRSVSAAFYSLFPNILPIVVVFGLLGWGGVRIDIGTMITASVAMGIAVDGTLHLITWFQKLIGQGCSREEAVAGALEHCGPAIWQTSAAIGFGLLTLYPVDLLLISRFGWIMSSLIFAALWGDIILLPSLLAGRLGAILERLEKKKKNSKVSGSGDDRVDDAISNPEASADERRAIVPIRDADKEVAAFTAQKELRIGPLRNFSPRPARDV